MDEASIAYFRKRERVEREAAKNAKCAVRASPMKVLRRVMPL